PRQPPRERQHPTQQPPPQPPTRTPLPQRSQRLHSHHPRAFTLDRACFRARLSRITRVPLRGSCPRGSSCSGVRVLSRRITFFLAMTSPPCAEGASNHPHEPRATPPPCQEHNASAGVEAPKGPERRRCGTNLSARNAVQHAKNGGNELRAGDSCVPDGENPESARIGRIHRTAEIRIHKPKTRIHDPVARIHKPKPRTPAPKRRNHGLEARTHEPKARIHELEARIHTPEARIHELEARIHTREDATPRSEDATPHTPKRDASANTNPHRTRAAGDSNATIATPDRTLHPRPAEPSRTPAAHVPPRNTTARQLRNFDEPRPSRDSNAT